MSGDIKVHVEPHVCVEWTVEMPTSNEFKRSAVFAIGDTRYSMRVDNAYQQYELALYPMDQLPASFMITACLSKGIDLFMPHTTTIEGNEEHYDIWTVKESDVSKFVPDSSKEKHICCFRVVFQASFCSQENPVDKSVQTSSYWDTNSKFESLSQDLAKMLDESSNTDVDLKCGDKIFRVHRSLLSCRSEVFRAMLKGNTLEGKTGQVLICDMEADHLFEDFLLYLYTGKLPEELTVDSALHLYELGDKYAVLGMKDECREFLTENLAPYNACDILKLADRHSDQDFRKCVTEYILEKKIPLYDIYWSDFCHENPQLANEIYGLFVQFHVPM